MFWSQMTGGQHGRCVGAPGRPCWKHSFSEPPVPLYFQNDRCSKQCGAVSQPLKLQHLDFSWWEGRVNADVFLIWGANSLQRFRAVWSQPQARFFSSVFWVILLLQSIVVDLKCNLRNVSQVLVQRHDAPNCFVPLGLSTHRFNERIIWRALEVFWKLESIERKLRKSNLKFSWAWKLSRIYLPGIHV